MLDRLDIKARAGDKTIIPSPQEGPQRIALPKSMIVSMRKAYPIPMHSGRSRRNGWTGFPSRPKYPTGPSILSISNGMKMAV